MEHSNKEGFDLIWSRNEAQLVDALAVGGDEGRSMAAISHGEVPNNL